MAVCNVYMMLIVVYVLFSWFPHQQGIMNEIYNFLAMLCEPYLKLFRALIPPVGGMLDITPIIALLVLQLGVPLLLNIF